MPFSVGNTIWDAVVFDLDGTLIDSIDVYVRILNIAFRRIGVPEAPRDQVLAAIRDGGFDWNQVLADLHHRQREEIIQKTREIVGDLYKDAFRNDVTLIPGTDLLSEQLSAQGIRLGIVTSTLKRFIEYKLYPLRNAGIDNLFEAVITSDDVQQKKPAADPLIECAKRLSVDPQKMIYVGDTAIDIQAGKAAGAMTVGVLTGVDNYETLKTEDPDAIIESIAGLRRLIRILPILPYND